MKINYISWNKQCKEISSKEYLSLNTFKNIYLYKMYLYFCIKSIMDQCLKYYELYLYKFKYLFDKNRLEMY